jgi:undecaprenyl-diphosphatase
VRVGRFTRRAGLRSALAAALAAPLGREAAVAAAATGAAQEQPVGGTAAGLASVALVVRRGSRRAAGAGGARWSPARVARLAAGVGAGLATRAVWSVASRAPAAVAPSRTWTGLEPDPDGTGVAIVVNPSAGSGRTSLGPDPAEALRQGLPGAKIVVPDDPSELPDLLDDLATSGIRAIGIAGGDGSINTAAGVALRHRLPLVVVPAGTLNHLARDLGVETVEEAVEAVRSGTALEIDVARIAGRPFLNTASFGSYVEIVDARQDLEGRIGKWPALVVALARVLRHGAPVVVDIDGDRRRLWAVFIGNCRYQPAGMAPTWRDRLDDGQLDVRIADASQPFSRARLVLAVMTGRLHRSVVFSSWSTTDMRVSSTQGPLRLARDGETFDGDAVFDVAKAGDRLAVYAPRPPEP